MDRLVEEQSEDGDVTTPDVECNDVGAVHDPSHVKSNNISCKYTCTLS